MKLKLNSILSKVIISILFFSSFAFSNEVLVTTKDIKFKDKIDRSSLVLKSAKVPYNCTPIRLEDLENGVFTASKYIFKNRVLCVSDVVKYKKESVVFDFGLLEIEQRGKILFENDEYIRIKREDGTIEKIYKNGKIR